MKLLLVFFISVLLPSSSFAKKAKYDVAHNFKLKPSTGRIEAVRGKHREFALATQHNKTVKNGSLKFTYFAIPRGGVNGRLFAAKADATKSNAGANSSFDVSAWGPGSSVSGISRAFGYADARVRKKPVGYARATSANRVEVAGKILKGKAYWKSAFVHSQITAGSATETAKRRGGGGRDPIDFELKNIATGEMLSGTLLSVDFDFGYDHDFSWEDNLFSLSMPTGVGEFHIDISSPYTSQQGILDLTVSNGLVTTSNDDGIFDGVLPSVGTESADLVFDLPSLTQLDFDFSSFASLDNISTNIIMGGDGYGEAEVSAVPVPAAVWLFISGLIGLGAALFKR